MIAEELSSRNIPYTCVDGISGEGSEQTVKHPSLQSQDIEADLHRRTPDTPLLFISHCIGTIAALNTVDKLGPKHQTSLVSIAPPLPSPIKTIMQPQSQKKRTANDTLMRVVDLPEGAVDYSVMTESVARIHAQYFEDMRTANDLESRLRTRVEVGRAAVFAPEHDWNSSSPLHVQSWHDLWSATLPEQQASVLRDRAAVVYNAAHGLYVSPRVGREVTTSENVNFQKSNVRSVVDTGLGLLGYRPRI
jgi:hypothetical protein